MPSRPTTAPAHAPETLEGWYALHQVFSRERGSAASGVVSASPRTTAGASPDTAGWSAYFRLIGSRADLLAVHFRPTLEAIATSQQSAARTACGLGMDLAYSFLSVTEAGLYHLTAQLAREAEARGGAVGDATYTAELSKRIDVERENPHVQRRLYPVLPEAMPYVCFYPMSKRRETGQNWYTLSLEERSRLMREHGATGRRYAGRVLQIITGAIGFDAWEWAVTLFARDPLDFKKLVSEMRFDEASAKYAEFGEFFVGKLIPSNALEAGGGLETI
ncbi:MAG TPA: chlorite dismutase family protein [Gemmatimonadaceae bacterium]|nr:chlorite dismutase family protein [Gemmatimonadaceae bacterium]